MMNNLLSICLLSYYSQDKINKVYAQVKTLLDKEKIDFEFIIIDDGSADDSFEIAKKLEDTEKNVRAYQLSRNYTTSYSIFAGLELCSGSCATAIPDDEQQPYGTIVEMYRLWESGEKIIIPHRNERDESIPSYLFSRLFYNSINRLSEIKYPKGGADLFFIDREIIDIINTQLHVKNTYIVPELLRLGFNPCFLPYSRPKSTNKKSRWNFKKKYKLSKDIFFSSSTFPIKLISMLGLLFSGFSFLLILFYIYIKLFGNKEFWGNFVPGWTSLLLAISFFSGIILFSLGIISEYIWRIYEEVKGRPPYIIKHDTRKYSK